MAIYSSVPKEIATYLAITDDTAAATGSNLVFLKTNAGAIVANSDYIGRIDFYGDDGASSQPGAAIKAKVVGAPAATRVPTNLEFYTHPDSAAANYSLRMTIGVDGQVLIAAPDSGTGLTIAGGGLTVTGPISYTSTTVAISASAASATALTLEATDAAGGIRLRAGTGGITLGDEATTTPISIGDVAPTASRTITISGGQVATAAVTDTLDLGVDAVTTEATASKIVNIGTGTLDTGTLTVNIASGTVTSGTHAINLATGTGTSTVTIGNADALTTTNVYGPVAINTSVNENVTINVGTSTGYTYIGNALAGAFTADSAAGISLDAALASNFTVSTAANDLTLQSSLGTVIVNSGEDTPDAIYLHANGGVTETIRLHADQSTTVDSVHLESDLGGVTLTATANATADAINLNAPAGGIDIDASLDIVMDSSAGALDLDAVTTSHITVTGAAADMLVSSVGGSVNIDGSEADIAAVSIQASDVTGGIDIDSGSLGIDILATGGPISIDAEGTMNVTTTGAFNITVNSTAGSVILDGGEAVVDAVQITASAVGGGVDINANTGGLTLDSGDLVSIQGAAASDFSTSAGDLTLESTAGSVILNGGEAAVDAVQVTSSNAAGGVAVSSGTAGTALTSTGATTIDCAGVLELNSSAAAISIGNDAVAQAVNIGTGAANRTTTVGSTNTTSTTTVQSGTGGIVLNAAGLVSAVPGTATAASPAATVAIDTNIGVATFTGFTTAAAATQVFTIANALCTAGSAILVSASTLGANDAQMTVYRVTPAAGSFTVTLTNNGAAAVNGNILITYWLLAV